MALAPVVRDDFSAPFFDGTSAGRLLLRFSPSSGEWSEPAARFCSVTQADDLEWRESSGRGTLVSWTIKPGRTRDEVTTPDVVIGIVELEEGPWLSLWLPEVDPSRLVEGAAVTVGFVQPEGSEHLPVAGLS
ncbi:Zn-ribbon domain-containing OB-fold protein [Nocardioides alcanivorans]|uniref:Zn-ribbon domain-containing OB-fold protein n=1 Tax=Nocardioides alcanivorans TaxID=2897352 RepID=UPI001F249782|nr:OB-fold domain-containing protein [Nocardioides alcanivorans]